MIAQWLRVQIACQCRGHGFKPWSGNIPHAAEQLSSCATTTEPMCLEPVLRNKRSHHNEKHVHCNERVAPSPQLEKAHARQRRTNTAKNLKKKNLRGVLGPEMSRAWGCLV